MKTKMKAIFFASLLFGVSGFSTAQATTVDELLVEVQEFAQQVVQAFGQVTVALDDHESRVSDNESRIDTLEGADLESRIADLESRIDTLEAEPKTNIAMAPPTASDDINAGFTEGSLWVDMTTRSAFVLVDSAPGAAAWELITNRFEFYKIG